MLTTLARGSALQRLLPATPLLLTRCYSTQLIDQMGGPAGVKKAVDLFYDKMMADQDMAKFFEGIDMAKQRTKQFQFMQYVFGGPDSYTGKDLYETHIEMRRNTEHPLTEEHFDRVKEYLAAALKELKVPQDVINHAADVVETTRPIIFRGE